MKKTFKALKFSTVFLLFLASFIACDKDFSVIESDVLGIENANFSTDSLVLPISAYNKKLDSLQINNLPSNLLGVYNDPDYGKTTASFVTQLTPTTFSEDFGTNPVIDSVVINIPYFSTVIDSDENGNATYQLDSIYGNPEAKFKLTIYQNNYFLRDFDPNGSINTAQNYFSNASSASNSVLNGTSTINFDDHLGEMIFSDADFIPSSKAIVITTEEGENEVETRSEPAFRKTLDNAFWQTIIFEQEDDAVFSNANNFRNYFRGLYFKAEPIDDDGNIVLINLGDTNANITVFYTTGEEDDRFQDSYVLNFSGIRLNTFINDFSIPAGGDKIDGDQTLYLKGLEGSMAVVDLFPDKLVECGKDENENPIMETALNCFLKTFRKTDKDGNYEKNNNGEYVLDKLINEAHLVLQDDVTNADLHIYDRIYAYDVKNNTTIIDYVDALDPTGNTTNPVFSKIISLGQRDGSGRFKIRITEHINNIIQNDSTNYKIGLVLSNNVNVITNSEILNSNDDVTAVPTASIVSPRGTIIFGSKEIPDKEDKKLQLKIFFTEPKDN